MSSLSLHWRPQYIECTQLKRRSDVSVCVCLFVSQGGLHEQALDLSLLHAEEPFPSALRGEHKVRSPKSSTSEGAGGKQGG